MKTCSRCHINRESSEFYKRRTSADGLDSWCKPCRREIANGRYRDANPGAGVLTPGDAQAGRALVAWLVDSGATLQWIAEQVGCNRKTVRAVRDGDRCLASTVSALRGVAYRVGQGLLIPPGYAEACDRREKRERKRAERDRQREVETV